MIIMCGRVNIFGFVILEMAKKFNYKIIILSVVLGLLVWVIDAIVDVIFFYEGRGFWELLIFDIPPVESYIRFMIMVSFVIFGIVMGGMWGKVESAKGQLEISNEQLEARNRDFQANEEQLNKINYDLNERIKELNCLYGMVDLVEKHDISLEGIFEGLLDLIPPSWQYPEITCARLKFAGVEYKTSNFVESPWVQSADILVGGEKRGFLEVFYEAERPAIYEGPFLREERDLLDALAERLGRVIEREQTNEAGPAKAGNLYFDKK